METTLSSYPLQKIAICVFGCISIEKYKEQIMKIEETWGKRALEKGLIVYYFLGEEDKNQGIMKNEYIYLPNIGNDYESASHKQNLGLKYICDNHPDVEYVYVCGTDTYINIDKLMYFLHTKISFITNENKLYIGGHNCQRMIKGEQITFHMGGAGFILNKKALETLYPLFENMFEEWRKVCNNHPDIVNACDLCIGFFAKKLDISFLQFWYSFFDCDYHGYKTSKYAGEFYVCCEHKVVYSNLVSCHNMSLKQFDDFTKILEENNYFMDTDIVSSPIVPLDISNREFKRILTTYIPISY